MLDSRSTSSNNNLWIFVGIFLLSIVVRIITAEYIDIGGDNSEKWRQVMHLVQGQGYTAWYQQTVRWGILLPLAGIIKIFGYNPTLTYIQPIFFSSIAAALIFLIGDRLHSRSLGISTAIATILFPQMAQTGSQLWPGVFELAYIALSIWLILLWIDRQSTLLLALAVVAFFLGWGCRVTMLYAAPGLALLIWLPTRNFKALCFCCLSIGALCSLEWIIFWQVTGNPLGRLGILAGTHIQTAGLDISITDYLLNIKKLVKLKGLIAIWALCFLASTYVAFTGSKRWQAIAWLYIIHAFLLLYMISSVSPLKLAMPVGTRFWGVIAPVGLLVLFKVLFEIKRNHPNTGKVLITLIFLIFLIFTAKKIPPMNSVVQMNRDYNLLMPLLAGNKPIIMHYEHWQPNFIEEFVISKLTGKKGERIPREDHVKMAIWRNQHRMVALFVTDLSRHDEFKKRERLKQIDYTVYQLTPPGASPDDTPVAEIKFGRKLHSATLIDTP